jgi:hypothetical protein
MVLHFALDLFSLSLLFFHYNSFFVVVALPLEQVGVEHDDSGIV